MKKVSVQVPKEPGLSFQLGYEDEYYYDTIYRVTDQKLAPNINVYIINDGDDYLDFQGGSEEVGEENYHFGLKIPKGLLLDLGQSEILGSVDWDVGYDPDSESSYEVIYFLSKKRRYVGSLWLTFELTNFCASPLYDKPEAIIYLIYGKLVHDKDGNSLEGNNPESKLVTISDLTGKSNIPLHVGFVGSNTILNDGSTNNSLTLRITNTNSPNSFHPNLRFSDESEFSVSFETGEEGEKPYALAKEESVKGIQITERTSNWMVQANTNTLEWQIKPQRSGTELAPGEYIEVTLGNIVSNHPTGNANLYLRYHGIPDYRDGQFAVPIEKTPLKIRENVEIYAKSDILMSSPESVDTLSLQPYIQKEEEGTYTRAGIRLNDDIEIGTEEYEGELQIISSHIN
ncbi:MAG: hypothetical protein F6K55_23825 [Moorea sp. SIO4A3]|nr:hypothetical protein [Moorena sp. SIO4A3]